MAWRFFEILYKHLLQNCINFANFCKFIIPYLTYYFLLQFLNIEIILLQFVIATLLVVISMANAEPSRFGPTSRQTASYKANNWKPQGTPFVLPQRQQQPSYNTPTFQNPSTKYGVPESQLSESNKRESIEVNFDYN